MLSRGGFASGLPAYRSLALHAHWPGLPHASTQRPPLAACWLPFGTAGNCTWDGMRGFPTFPPERARASQVTANRKPANSRPCGKGFCGWVAGLGGSAVPCQSSVCPAIDCISKVLFQSDFLEDCWWAGGLARRLRNRMARRRSPQCMGSNWPQLCHGGRFGKLVATCLVRPHLCACACTSVCMLVCVCACVCMRLCVWGSGGHPGMTPP
jgi:hypothetical protein